MIPLTSVPDIEDVGNIHDNKHNAEHKKVSMLISAEVTDVTDVNGIAWCHYVSLVSLPASPPSDTYWQLATHDDSLVTRLIPVPDRGNIGSIHHNRNETIEYTDTIYDYISQSTQWYLVSPSDI